MDWKRILRHFRQLLSSKSGVAKKPACKRSRQMQLEQLEDRITPTTFTVTDLTDNAADTGSIRYAVNQVNADSSTAADTINLAGVSGTILLSNGVLGLTRTAGPVVITGPGASILTISGNHASQVWNFASGVSASLSGLTIANGQTSGQGGGIFDGGTLSIVNSAFTGDTSTGNNGNGGAIYNNSTLLISGCSFISDSATAGSGGAIYNNNVSTLAVVGCTFMTNSAKSAGGAIFQTGTLNLSGSTFNGNTANSQGGAIYSTNTANINGCTFSNNSAPNGGAIYNTSSFDIGDSTFNGNSATSGSGGGVRNAGGALTVSSSTFSGNSATVDGGGAYFSSGSPEAVSNTTFTANSAASNDGGGFYIQSGATVSLLSSIVVGNTTTNTGTPNDVSVGAGSLNAVESAYNLIGTGGSGGLIQGTNNNQVGVSVGSADLSTLANNGGPTQTIALLGGSAALQAGSSVLTFALATLVAGATNNTFAVPDATFLGVGEVIEIDSEQMQITAISGKTLTVVRGFNGTTVATHTFGTSVTSAGDQRGFSRTVGGFTDVGAVEQNLPGSAPAAPPSFTATTFKVTDLTDNASDTGSIRYAIAEVNADSSSGTDIIDLTGVSGAIILSNGVLGLTRTSGPVVITGPGAGALTISGNHASEVLSFASGMTASLSGVTIANGLIAGNGGGIFNAGTLSIVNSAFTGDAITGSHSGGAIYNNGTLFVSGSSLTGNTSNQSGGAINNNGQMTIVNCTFANNSATGGGAIYQTGTTLLVTESTFTGNSSGSGQGGAIGIVGAFEDYINGNTFSNNSAGQGGAIYSSRSLTVSNTTFTGNVATYGGGIYEINGPLAVSNSTFFSNSANSAGGGAYFTGGGSSITVANSTMTGNSAGGAGGLFIPSGTVSLLSSIVAGNANTIPGTPADLNTGLNTVKSAYNLIGTGGSGGLVQGTNNNQVGVSVASAGLSAFGNYGGPTSTIALFSGSAALQTGSSVLTTALATLVPSPVNNTFSVADATFLGVGEVIAIDNEQMQITAINANKLTVVRGYNATTVAAHAFGASLTPPTDQRGFPRSVGGLTDVGAFEQSVPNAPIVLADPVSTTANVGQNAAFTATASGNPTPTVQWQVNAGGGFTNITDGGVYSGSATTTLTVTGAGSGMMGYQYQAVFTNSNGSATTAAGTLSVDSILTQPANSVISIGQNTTFTAASTVGTDTVQWQVSAGSGFFDVTNGGVYSNANTNALTITGATAAMNGYQYRAVFTNVSSSLTTSSATLTVGTAPAVTTQPVNQAASVGGVAIFTAAASGPPTPTVQWYVNTNNGTGFNSISGAVSTTLTLINVTASQNNYQYEAIFTNGLGAVATNAVTLTVTTTSQMTPVVTWPNPADIMDGTPLGSAQLDASANVPGTFTYIPAAGTVLPVGQNQSLFVVFTPTDATDYIVAGASADINVDFGPAAKLAFVQQPLATSSGSIIAPAVTVAVEDAAGTTLPNDSSTVTLTISSGTFVGGGTTATAQAVNGVATFNGLAISNNGTYSLTATDASLASTGSNSFSIGATTFVNFNDGATDFTSEFSTSVNFGAASMNWNATAGIDDRTNSAPGGGVKIAGGNVSDETAVYNPATFNLSDGNAHTVSLFLTAAANLSASDRNQIGFVVGSNGEFNANYLFVSACIFSNDSIQFQICYGAGQSPLTIGSPTGPTSGSIATGDWLQLVFTAQEDSQGTFTLKTSLLDYGQTGAAVPTIVVAPVSTTVSGFLPPIGTGSPMYAGFRTSTFGEFSTPLDFDNFAVDLPPAKTALLSHPSVAAGGVAMSPFVVAVEDSNGNIVVGDSSTVTLTLNQGTFAGGGTSVSATAVDGIATFNNLVINTLGSYILTATDTNPNLTSSAAALTVNAATTTSVTSNPVGPLTPNEPVTFTATIAGSPSVGTVTFYAGPGLTNEIGSPMNVSGGTATSASDTSLSAGAYTVTAVYSGGTGFVGSQGTLPLTVDAPPTLAGLPVVNGSNAVINIVSATGDGTTATITTDGTLHGFWVGELVTLTGLTPGGPGGLAGTVTVTGVPSATTFQFASAYNGSEALTGATVTAALAGVQRSMVDSIVYNFTIPVNLTAAAFTITVIQNSAGSTVGIVPTVNVAAVPFTNEWVVTFTDPVNLSVIGNSIANGAYTIAINPALVTAVSGGQNLAAGETDTFYRLYGDVTGVQSVKNVDANAFNRAWGSFYYSASYNVALDYNDDGKYTNIDANAFNRAFNTRYQVVTTI